MRREWKSAIRGVLGVMAQEDTRLVDLAEGTLGGVEVRADFFPTIDDALAAAKSLAQDRKVLFTLRRAEEGGRFDGDEQRRIVAYRQALECGCALVDAEWGTPTAHSLANSNRLVVSHHDFRAMPTDAELNQLTADMERLHPAVIKVVPTAANLFDSFRMLRWVGEARNSGAKAPCRVGFAMGDVGLVSRVLSMAWGAPFTYGAVTTVVAPGQVTAAELINLYRVGELSKETQLLGVVGNPVLHSRSPHMHNPQLAREFRNAVYVPLLLQSLEELDSCWIPLRIRGVSVTIPFKQDAWRRADERDARSDSCQAANTLLAEPRPDGSVHVRCFNTDFDGVVVPLETRLGSLAGTHVAVLGNGGAARGAVTALAQAKARVTLYWRNKERGSAVAASLGVPSAHLTELASGRHRVIINATSLGLRRTDPSPVAAEAWDPSTIAFDMIYEPADTQFLRDARAAGASVITGREMLVAQGVAQYELFWGSRPSPQAFEASLQGNS